MEPASSALPPPPDLATPPIAVASGSYRRILHATSLLGGATAVNLLIGMLRSKLVAVLLGPSGVGLMGMYQSITGLVSTVAGCGLNYSAVRELSEASAATDEDRVREAVRTFRSLSLGLGLVGTLVMAIFAWPFSMLMFENGTEAVALAWLSLTIGGALVSNYYTVLIQSSQQIAALARMNVLGSLLGSIVSVGCFALWHRQGLVPALLAGTFVQGALAWWYARSARFRASGGFAIPDRAISGRLLRVGSMMVLLGLLSSLVMFTQRLMLLRWSGEADVGVFQSAISLSGMYAGYILGAMGTDFLPRLSAVTSEPETMNRLVNEQTRVALLLGLPGIAGTITFAPLIIPLFYSEQFSSAVPVLQWMAMGVFGRLVSWPLGFVLIAMGRMKAGALADILGHVINLGVTALLFSWFGVVSTGLAAMAMYLGYSLAVRWWVGHLTGFIWSNEVRQTIVVGLMALIGTLLSASFLGFHMHLLVAGLVTLVTGLICLQQLTLVTGVTQMGILRVIHRWRRKSN